MKAILTICALAASFAAAQTLEFEAAAIKPFERGPGVMGLGPGVKDGLFHARTSLLSLIATAYGVRETQVLSPAWLNDDEFEILAKVPAAIPNTASMKLSDPNMEKMLQALLQKRFSLATHTETRETNVYELVVAKDGIKMSRHGEHPDGPPHPPNARGANQMAATTTMDCFATQLSMSMIAGKPVIDKTGLDGQFNIFLYYAPFSPEGNDKQIDAPILTDAIQQQLGL